jgi:hypothetical protein
VRTHEQTTYFGAAGVLGLLSGCRSKRDLGDILWFTEEFGDRIGRLAPQGEEDAMTGRSRIGTAAVLLGLLGCSSERDLGNLPDGGGSASIDFAGAYAGVLTQGSTSCPYGPSWPGSSSNAVMTLGMPGPTEVDITSITWCTVRGKPSGNVVHIQAVVCPTMDSGGETITTMFTDMSQLSLTDATTLEVYLYTSTTYVPVAGAPMADCVSTLSGTLTKQ